ncbi:hypothetical protein ABKV19_027357, partial [Rosa sericea]
VEVGIERRGADIHLHCFTISDHWGGKKEEERSKILVDFGRLGGRFGFVSGEVTGFSTEEQVIVLSKKLGFLLPNCATNS